MSTRRGRGRSQSCAVARPVLCVIAVEVWRVRSPLRGQVGGVLWLLWLFGEEMAGFVKGVSTKEEAALLEALPSVSVVGGHEGQ